MLASKEQENHLGRGIGADAIFHKPKKYWPFKLCAITTLTKIKIIGKKKKEYGKNDGWDCLVWVTVSYYAVEGINS